MRLRSITSLVVTAAATFVAYGCANDSPAAPKADIAPPSAASADLLGSLLGAPKTITPIQRARPLKTDISTSKTIGILGGTLAIPEAGLTVVVPPLAVSRPTEFKVTARAGSAMAYDFEPHGRRFTTPLIMTQNLRGVKADGGLLNLGLQLGYYPDNSRITSVTELLNVNVDQFSSTAVSTIWHFSGYIYASGRSDNEDQ